MVDVVICYAREDGALARQLAGAVAQLGYRLWSEDEADDDVTGRIGGAKAAIVLWSRSAAASEWVRAEANYARGQDKLIQAAADDAPPPLPFRAADVVSLAGWRGEATHPGWRRIRARLEALCGAPAAAARAARTRAVAPAAAPERRRGGGLLILVTLAFLAAVGLATFVWMQGLAPTAAPRQAAPPPPVASPAAPPAALPFPTAAPEPPPPEPDAGPVEAPPPPPPAGPRINRRNAENMRLFCERAGRGTPQCRTFERRLRDQRR